MKKRLLVIIQSKYSRPEIAIFASEKEVLQFNDSQGLDGPYVEMFYDDNGIRHPRGTWMECDPSTCTYVDPFNI